MQKKSNKNTRNDINQPIHVKLETPLNLRKKILTAAIASSKMLQAYSQLEEIQEERKAILSDVDATFKEINILTKKFRSLLPNIHLHEDLPKIKEEIKYPIKLTPEVKEIPATNTRDSEVDQLKKELAEIDHKLKHY